MIKRGVDAMGGGIDEQRQSLHIGREQFANAAQFQNQVHQRVLIAEFVEHLFGGGILPGFGFFCFSVEMQMFE